MAERPPHASPRACARLATALAVVVCGAAVVAFDAPQPLRAIAAGGLILWAPGYAVTVALLPPGAIGPAERAVLAVGASLALTVIPAILVDAAGVRLDTATFLITGCALTSTAAALAFRRLRSLAHPPALAPAPRPPLAAVGAAIAIGVVLAGSVAVARIPPRPNGIDGSSALAARGAGPGLIEVQVISEELAATSYRLTMVTGGSEEELLGFTLLPGDAWERILGRPLPSGPIELRLYRDDDEDAYRRVVLPSKP